MDFFKKRSTTRVVASLDLLVVLGVLAVCAWKLVEVIILKMCPEKANIEPMTKGTFATHIILWLGLFLMHAVPLCAAFALILITGKGRNEAPAMRAKCKLWLKSTCYLLVALSIVFIIFALDSDFQSYIGAGICAVEFVGKLFFRCFIGLFFDTLGGRVTES